MILTALDVLATLEVLALETISLVQVETIRYLTRRDERRVLVALRVLSGSLRQVHGTFGFRSVELNQRGALDGVGSLFGGGGNLSYGTLSNRFSCRRYLGSNLGDGLSNSGLRNSRYYGSFNSLSSGLCNRFGNNRLRNSGIGQCGRLGCENLLGQSDTGQRNLSQVTHRLGPGGILS